MAAEVAGQSETEGEAEPTVQVENADEDQVGEPEKKRQRTCKDKQRKNQENVETLTNKNKEQIKRTQRRRAKYLKAINKER